MKHYVTIDRFEDSSGEDTFIWFFCSTPPLYDAIDGIWTGAGTFAGFTALKCANTELINLIQRKCLSSQVADDYSKAIWEFKFKKDFTKCEAKLVPNPETL